MDIFNVTDLTNEFAVTDMVLVMVLACALAAKWHDFNERITSVIQRPFKVDTLTARRRQCVSIEGHGLAALGTR